MDPFPEHFELISIFESEPVLTDLGVPWAYNHLTFSTDRNGDHVECVIEPGYGILLLRWSREGHTLVDLTVERVKGLRVITEYGREVLVAEFGDRDRLMPLQIQLRPTVSVFWGTSNEP